MRASYRCPVSVTSFPMAHHKITLTLTLLFVGIISAFMLYLSGPRHAIGLQMGPLEIKISLYQAPRLETHTDCGLDRCPVLTLNFDQLPRLSARQENRAVWMLINDEGESTSGSPQR